MKHIDIIAPLRTPFSDVSAPTLKGEHQKIRHPLGHRGKANFQLIKVKSIILFSFFLLSLASFSQNVNTFQRTYGFEGYNYGRGAFQTGDGGYIILGDVSGSGRNTNIYLVKTDTLGKIEWDKRIGDTSIYWASDFKIAHDKGYIIAGYTDKVLGNGYDVLLIKTDSLGNEQWEKTYGGADWDMGYSVIEDKQHHYLIAGETFSYSFGNGEVYLIKTDSVGDTIWTKHYGGAGNNIAYSIDTSHSSNYIVAGAIQRIADSTYDAYLLKINNNGDTVWTKTFGDSLNNQFYCARQIDDSSYIMCGETQEYGTHPFYNAWVVKTDTLGNIRWTHVSTNPNNCGYSDIKRSWNNGLVAVGYTYAWGAGSSDLVGTTMTDAGADIHGQTFGGAKYDVGNQLCLTRDSCYMYTGSTESFGKGISSIYVIKSNKSNFNDSIPVQEDGIIEFINTNINFNVYPNPTAGLTNICLNSLSNSRVSIKVYNDLGSELLNEAINISTPLYIHPVNLSQFSDGMYFVKVSSNSFTYTSKVLKQSGR
jgi:hypothetical protein